MHIAFFVQASEYLHLKDTFKIPKESFGWRFHDCIYKLTSIYTSKVSTYIVYMCEYDYVYMNLLNVFKWYMLTVDTLIEKLL